MSDGLQGFFDDVNSIKRVEKMTSQELIHILGLIRYRYDLNPIENAVIKHVIREHINVKDEK